MSSDNVSIGDKTEEAKGPRVIIDKQKSKKQKKATVHGTENLFENMSKASVSPAYKAVDPNVSAAQGSADTAQNSGQNSSSNIDMSMFSAVITQAVKGIGEQMSQNFELWTVFRPEC